jgi:hypothetical protein
LAEYTREVHEEYAVQRWPETKRLLGLLVNSSGGAHARNARRLVHAARKQDRRLSAALLAAAVAHTPEAEEVLRGARTRMARKPSSLSRELLRNFPKGRRSRSARRRRKGREGVAPGAASAEAVTAGAPPGEDVVEELLDELAPVEEAEEDVDAELYLDEALGAADEPAAQSNRYEGPDADVVDEALRAGLETPVDVDAPLEDHAREQLEEAVADLLDEVDGPPPAPAEEAPPPRPRARR